ncbi:flavin reductase family protein [Sulfitobacter sp. MF3-043]|uniref:flavin reductase family protein n=1 Tax=Sulfitobacter sediminivivens TaxID=3252902 RepID=UPI0036DDDB4E
MKHVEFLEKDAASGTARSGQLRAAVAPLPTMSNDMKSFQPNGDTAQQLRSAFGRYGTGVTVVTTQTAAGPLGITANSFSSVSLDPPLVLWSPAITSKRHDAFATAAHFCIHVLAADQRALADHFATQGHGFDHCDWFEGFGGAPTLRGCLATFHCDTYAVHTAGDHSLILGHVKQAAELQKAGPGLMFDQGRYGVFSEDG